MDKTLHSPNAARFRDPERLAWGVLLIAFAIFCLICVLTVVAAHMFFFQSTIPMLVTVQPSRGTLGLTGIDLRESTVRESDDFQIGQIVRPNPQSQALVTFYDPYEDGRILVMLTLDEAISAVALRAAERPRFEWGNAIYQIDLDDVEGDVEIYIPSGFEDNFALYIQTKHGAQVRVVGSGRHHLRIFEDNIQVSNYQGEVVLVDTSLPAGQVAKSIPPGFQATIRDDIPEIVVVEQGLVTLLNNPHFEQVAGSLPAGWTCSNKPGSAPSGTISMGWAYGRSALFMVRGEGASTHGETTCQQGAIFEAVDDSSERTDDDGVANWIDVSQYDYLSLKTTFLINYQSLNRCGTQGSECPLMIWVDYIDRNGNSGEFIYGFYALNNPQEDYPTTCLSCRQDHIFVREKTWYTYSTGNILSPITDEMQRPHYITRVRFYASGHQYDMRISDLVLSAGDLTDGNTP